MKLQIDEHMLEKLFRELFKKLQLEGVQKSEFDEIAIKIGFGPTTKVTKNLLPFFRSKYTNVFYKDSDKKVYKLMRSPYNLLGVAGEYINFISNKPEEDSQPIVELKQSEIKIGDKIFYMSENKIHIGEILGMYKDFPESDYITYRVWTPNTKQSNDMLEGDFFLSKNELINNLLKNIE